MFSVELKKGKPALKLDCLDNTEKVIRELAEFIIPKPYLIFPLQEVVCKCFTRDAYEAEGAEIILSYEDKIDIEILASLEELTKAFFQASVDLGNDRGFLLEHIAELAICQKYSERQDISIQFHCQIEADLNGNSYTTAPHDVDICANGEGYGDFLECKVAINLKGNV